MKKTKPANEKYDNDFIKNAGYKLAFFVVLFMCKINTGFSQNPQNPVTTYVTVSHLSEKPIVHWTHPDQSSVDGYIIKRFIYQHPTVLPNTYHTIDTINNPNLTSYEDFTTVKGPALPYNRNEIYRIVAFKNSGNQMLLSTMSELHKTIYVNSEYEYCESRNKITWSHYVGWHEQFTEYRVYSCLNGGSFELTGNTLPGDTIFYHENILSENTYRYYIQAYKSPTLISESNINELYTDAPAVPNFLNVDSVIVFDNKSIRLYFDVDGTAEIEKYELYKSQDKYSGYNLISEYTDKTTAYIEFEDDSADIRDLNYYYLAVKDYCDDSVFISDTVNNIVLSTELSYDSDYIINLSWEGVDENINNNIYRTFNNEEYSNIESNQNNFYEDDLTDFYSDQYFIQSVEGKFCYYIRSYDSGKDRIYISNLDCITPKEKIFIPNAFNPKSKVEENSIFKPKLAYVKDYLLSIYNRWGVKVFETKNPNEGWDGKLANGKIAPVQTFIYYLRYKDINDKTITIKGHVNLVY